MEKTAFFHFLKTKEEEIESSYSLYPRVRCFEMVEKRIDTPKLLVLFPWEIKKVLKPIDLRPYLGLELSFNEAWNHILKYIDDRIVLNLINRGEDIPIKIRDMDTYTEHDLFVKKTINSERFYIEGCWFKEFVLRRKLREGMLIGMYWDKISNNLRFSVLNSD